MNEPVYIIEPGNPALHSLGNALHHSYPLFLLSGCIMIVLGLVCIFSSAQELIYLYHIIN
jgi:uncharacterized membrane protein HdeD (DUF308 family)